MMHRSNTTKLREYSRDKKQFRNRGARNLSLILLDILSLNQSDSFALATETYGKPQLSVCSLEEEPTDEVSEPELFVMDEI